MTAVTALVFLLVILARVNVYAGDVQTVVPAIGEAESANSYQYEIPAKAGGNALTIPIEISSAGLVKLEVAVQAEKDFTVMMTKKMRLAGVADVLWVAGNARQKNYEYFAEGSCTRYLNFFTEKEQTLKVTIKAYQNTATVTANGKLKNKKWANGFAYSRKSAYFQVKAGSSGCFQIDVKPLEKGQPVEITLLNSKKKEVLTDSSSSYEKTTYYGVKKGTYYIRVDTDGEFQIRSTFETIKEKNNTNKAKAVNLKQGKTEKGMFWLGDKKISVFIR